LPLHRQEVEYNKLSINGEKPRFFQKNGGFLKNGEKVQFIPLIESCDFSKKMKQNNKADYQSRIAQEINHYKEVKNVHDLPEIAIYWANKYLLPIALPFGFASVNEFYCLYVRRIQAFPQETYHFISIGAGNCDMEAELVETLLKGGLKNLLWNVWISTNRC